MSRTNPMAPGTLRPALALLCAGLFISASAPIMAIGDACDHATTIGLHTTQRHYADAAVQCFDIYVPESGILLLEVTVPAATQAEPRLDFHGSADGLPRHQYLERLPASLLLEIREAGTYRLGVRAQDPRLPLGEYRLQSGVAAVQFTTKEGDPEEDEPDPDPIVANPFEPSGIPSELCARTQADDHGDSSWCASTLRFGQEVTAVIGDEGSDDDDFFSFILTDLQTVRIESEAD